MAQNPFSGLFDEETKQQQEQESGRVSVSQSEPSQTKTPDNPFSGLFAEEKAQAPAPVQSVQQPAQAAEPEKKKDGGVFGFLSKAYDVVQTAGNIAFGKINIDPEKGYQGYQRGTDVAAEKLGETKFIKEVAEAQVTLESLEAQGEYTPTFRDNLGMNVLRTAAAAGGDVKWAMNTDTGKEIIKKVEGGTSNLPLKGVAVLRSFGKETYDEAYKAMLEDRENPENGAFKSFLYELQDSGTQSMVGVLLALGATAATRNPKAGLAISSPYYAALSGAEQIESKGEVYSSTNIGIDVVGDQILNAALTGIFRQPTTALGRIATDFGIEGTTEVSQSLLKFSNDYANAQSDEEREAILNDAKQYVTSGAIAMEFFVGATVGAIAGAGTEVMSKKSTPTDKKDEAPTQEDTKNPLGKAGEIIAKQQRGEELTQEEVAIAQQAQERFIDYSNTFGERTVYFPETNQNGTSISVEVLPLGDGKFATAYSATAGDVAINVAYDLNETFTSEKEATNQALERIAQWVDTQKVRTDLDPVVVGRLEDIAQKAKKPEPKKLTVKKVEEVPPMKQPETAPVVDSKRKEIDARASRSAKGKPTKKVGAETKKKPVLPSSKKKEAERATKDLLAGWQATAQDSIYYKPGKDGQEPIKIFALNDNAERDGTFRVQGNGVMVKEGGKDKLFGSLDDALRFANSNESVLRNLEDDQNATDATTKKEKVEEDPNEMSEVLRPQYGGKVPGRYDQEMVNKAQRWLAQAGRSNRVALLTPKFVAWMKKHRIGVRELEGDYSLFRTGRINPGQVQSFSILNNGWDGTEQYFVPKESVVLNFASNEYVDVLRNTFWGKDLELALESHAAWMDREGGEVLVEAPEAGLRPVNAKQPRDDAGRYLPFETIEQEVGDTFEEVAKRVQKAESDTTRPSRFLPRTPEGSQPFGDLTIDQKKLDRNDNVEVKKLVRRSEIAKELAERLNIVIRRGKMRQQATGVYKKKQKVIRLSQKYQNERFGGEITTLFHEIGHFIDFAVQPMRGLIPKNEVMPLLKEYGGGGETVSPPKRRPEAFAEFLRYYMTDPKKAKDRAPKFFEIFEQTMEKYPDVYAPIQDAKKQFAMWADQPPVARQMARIGYGDIKTGSRFARLGKKIKVLAHRGYTSFVNRIHPIDQFSELYKKLEGGDIASRQDPGLLAQNMNGWIGLAQHFLEYGTIKRSWYQEAQKGKVGTVKVEGKPLKEILLPIDKLDAMREFSAYLVSRRDIELGAREITTGATAGDAEATIEYLERKFPAFKQAAEELDTYQTSLLDMLVEYGVLDPAMKKTMQDMNKMYVPFYRVQEEITQKDFMGRTLQSKNPIKKIKGSQRDIADPIDSIIKNTYTFANLARRNEVMQAFALGAEKHPDLGTLFERVPGDMAKVATVDAKDIAYKAFGADSEFAKNFLPTEVQMFIEMVMPEKLVPIFRPTFSQQGDVVTVLDGGKAKHYYVDRDLYEAIEGMNIDQAGFYMNLFAFPAQTLRAGATLTPEFMARNPMRDTFVAGIQTKHGFRLGFDTVRGLASLLKKDEAYKAWLIEGGNLSSLVSMDRKQLAETQKTLLRRSERMKNLVKNPLEVLQILSAAMEQATRIGEARRALIKGEDPKQAARAAREISSDFLRMGSKIIPMSRVTAFFNVRVQGIDKMYRTFKDQPFKATAQSVLRITLPSIILYMINRDEEGWEEIPQWQKDVFWLVPIPRQFAQNIPGLVTEEQGENVWLRIPKPFEYGLVFGSLPERFMEYLDKKDPEKMDEVFRTLRTSFLPLPIPTGALPIMENWFNYSIFLDRPIIPRGKENLPAEDQYTDGTSEIAKIAGDAINYSPAKIDNLLYGYFAGLGRYATESVDSVLKGTGIVSVPPEPAATPSEIPVQKAFVVRAPIGSGSNSVETFYRRREEATVAHNKINMLLESGQTAEAREYLAEHPEAKLYTSYNRVAKKMGEIRAAKDRIYQSETMSPEEKRKKLDKLDSIMTELAYRSVNIELK